jgi:alkane 1-monooxygenase
MKPYSYLLAYTIPATVFLSMYAGGYAVWLPVLYVFILIPVAELWVGTNKNNADYEAEQKAKKSLTYSLVLWLFVPIPFLLTAYLGYLYHTRSLEGLEIAGMLLSIALCNGGIGITIAHELVHRTSSGQRWLGRILLLSVLYMHFAIEHVRGHHALVATEEDPASARKGESYYRFWWRSVWGQWISAWNLEAERLVKQRKQVWSTSNEMLWFVGLQLAYLGLVYATFGPMVLLFTLIMAVASFSLLEAVNYIEHYGLERERHENGRYEKVTEHHSWNSDHVLSRMFLFELTRHSDHHATASRPYQVLRSLEASPQLPTGYPGMIILSFFPPLWFRVMDPLVDAYSN